VVKPSTLNMAVNEYFELEVVTPDDAPLEITSSDPKVVKGFGERGLVGLAMGSAKVTVKQGDKRQTVDVKVASTIEDMRIEPPLVALRVGQPMKVRVRGTVAVDGVRRDVDVAPEVLVWDKLPRYDFAQFDQQSLVFRGLKATDAPQAVRVLLGDELSAAASLTVTGGAVSIASLEDLEFTVGSFIPYPPITLDRRLGWGGLVYDGARGGLLLSDLAEDSALYRYRSRLPKGAIITGIGDVDFAKMTQAEIDAYFRAHPQLLGGEAIRYRLPGETDVRMFDYRLGGTVQAVGYESATVIDESAETIQFKLDVYFDRLAQYRFTDQDGNPLPGDDGGWHTFGPEATESLVSPRVPLAPSGTYIFYIQRQIASQEPQIFSINFRQK
jgi:hypothetical protein